MAGPGESGGEQQYDRETAISWRVGCGTDVGGLDETVGDLEHKVANGLSAVLG